MRAKSSFTWRDGVFLTFIGIVFMAGVVMPSLRRCREIDLQTVCGTRLKGLGTAMGVYAFSYSGAWPSIGSAESYDGPADPQASLEELVATGGICNLQHYWLIIHEGHCGVEQFSCPSDDEYQKGYRQDPQTGYGFWSWTNSSYAFQPGTRHERNKAYPSHDAMDPNVVLAGDKWTPGAGGKSLNHPRDGGNSLRMDYSVRFESWLRDAEGKYHGAFGWKGNDVYYLDIDPAGRPAERSRQGLPQHVNDSYLYWRE